ncbi:hypothetical protein ACFQZQ_12470 [Lysobacter koreensis]|uniref:DUF2269 family protein n=1 Tax=Lysobacter koreensis TaxID=266122 RepID=A0ABW2YPD0_9GAMM
MLRWPDERLPIERFASIALALGLLGVFGLTWLHAAGVLGLARQPLVLLLWLSLLLAAVSLPLAWWRSGVIRTEGGSTHRARQPAKYWIGFVAFGLVLEALIATLVFIGWRIWNG